MLDVLIKGGNVVDGTGQPSFTADVGIRDGLIVSVGATDESARRTIDADGLAVAPGFVDIHTHYDAQVLWDPYLTPSSNHGVTTAIAGNCGFGLAPLSEDSADYLTRLLSVVEGIPLEALREGVSFEWKSFGDYLDVVQRRLGVNIGFGVGHSTLRRAVMGVDAVGAEASESQIADMVRLLGESLRAGGIAFSSSIIQAQFDGDGAPIPSRFATEAEFLALAAETGKHPGTSLEFAPKFGYFDDQDVDLMAGMSAAANRPLNWNTLVVGKNFEDLTAARLRASDRAAAQGGRVVAIALPDAAEARFNLLTSVALGALPGWGDFVAMTTVEKVAMLRDPAGRDRLRAASTTTNPSIERMAAFADYTIVETFHADVGEHRGLRVGDVAAQQGRDAFDVFADIVLADDLLTRWTLRVQGTDEESWKLRAEVYRDPRVVVGGTDAGAHLDMIASTRAYTAGMLGEIVRERQLLTIEEAIHRMTDEPARLYGLRHRGQIQRGWHADIVVFDPERIDAGDVQTRFDLPAGAARLFVNSVGMEHVIVNGEPIFESGRHTEALPGTVIRSGRDTETVEARA